MLRTRLLPNPAPTRVSPRLWLLCLGANRRATSFYTAHPQLADDIYERGIDRLTPVYNMLDLTPQGRGDWYASLSYQPSNGALTKAT
ncbi:MAG TPA: hypothetical protein VME66_15695 [Candidatus Acidoferrales bacterium]|nr:hypothetical protein [Candidatus Acidoferrales bacterium]